MRFLGLILVTSLSFLVMCSAEPELADEEKDYHDFIQAHIEANIKYKVDLLSLKHGIDSEGAKNDLVLFFQKQKWSVTEDIDDIEKMDFLLKLLAPKELDIDEITRISETHNIPISSLAKLIYDYEIWQGAEACSQLP